MTVLEGWWATRRFHWEWLNTCDSSYRTPERERAVHTNWVAISNTALSGVRSGVQTQSSVRLEISLYILTVLSAVQILKWWVALTSYLGVITNPVMGQRIQSTTACYHRNSQTHGHRQWLAGGCQESGDERRAVMYWGVSWCEKW